MLLSIMNSMLDLLGLLLAKRLQTISLFHPGGCPSRRDHRNMLSVWFSAIQHLIRCSSFRGGILILVCAMANTAIATNVSAGPTLVGAISRPISRRLLITKRIDEHVLVTLKHNTRPEATAANDLGAVPDDYPMTHMLLQLQRPAETQQAFDQLVADQQNPNSPKYHHWLSATEIGQQFGLAQSDLDTITSWLGTHGLTVNVIYPNRTVIDFSGTAGEVRSAFNTEIHRLNVKGIKHIANISDPQIPAALAPAIVGVVGLNDFLPHPLVVPRSKYTVSATTQILTPADLATIYNIKPLFDQGYSGQGQTIVLIEDSDLYSASDWSTFRSTFGLAGYSSGSLTTIHPPPTGIGTSTNNCQDPGATSDGDETTLDAEWASAAAPNAAIIVASCANGSGANGLLIALQNVLAGNVAADVISVSFGSCEKSMDQAYANIVSQLYQTAAAEGVSVFVAAGDEGGATCDQGSTNGASQGLSVNGLASTPNNVAVGGTDFGDTYGGATSTYWVPTNSTNFGSAISYVPEIPWNGSCASLLLASHYGYTTAWGSGGFCNSMTASQSNFLNVSAGGGGASTFFAKPAWQSGITGIPVDGMRDLPDVSLFAANGAWGHSYSVCYSDVSNGGGPCAGDPSGWMGGGGGTSYASPIMAGIQALVDQKAGNNQGNPNPTYYTLAAQYSCNSSLGNAVPSTCIFHDVTQGDSDIPCLASTPNCYAPSGSYGVLTTAAGTAIAFSASAGWDFATGLGSVNAYDLVNDWPLTSPVIPPAVPVGLSVTSVADTQVSLAWHPSTDTTGAPQYRVYNNGTLLGTVTTNGATVINLSPATPYSFTVAACDSSGNCSAQSAPVTATTDVQITLSTPWFSEPDGYISRFVFSNTGAYPAQLNFSVSTEAGNSVQMKQSVWTVPASGQLVVNVTDLVTSFFGAKQGAAYVTVDSQPGAVKGIYNIVDASTGSISNTTLTAPDGVSTTPTILVAPYFSTAPGYTSQFVLANSGSTSAPYSIAVTTEDGNQAFLEQTTGTIPANGVVVLNASSIVSSFSGASRAAATFTIQAPSSVVSGLYQIVDTTTGSISDSTLMRSDTSVSTTTTLMTPWFSTAPGYVSRFAILNSGNTSASYSVEVIPELGNSVLPGTTTGTIGPGKLAIISAGDLVSGFSGATRASAIITVNGKPQDIAGEYEIVNLATGSVSLTALSRPTTATGASVTMQVPWFSVAPGYISRFAFVNTGTSDLSYSTRILLESGNTYLPPSTSLDERSGKLPANQETVIDVANLVGGMTAATRGVAVFTVNDPQGKIEGLYNIVNALTGSISNTPLLRPVE